MKLVGTVVSFVMAVVLASSSAAAATLILSSQNGQQSIYGTITHVITTAGPKQNYRLRLRGFTTVGSREFFCEIRSKTLSDLQVIEVAAGKASTAQIQCDDYETNLNSSNVVVVPMDGSSDPTGGQSPLLTITDSL